MNGTRSITRWFILLALVGACGLGAPFANAFNIGTQVFIDRSSPRSSTYSPATTATGDAPLASVTVRLFQSDGTTLITTVTTSTLGTNTFTGLSAGSYVVKVDTTDPDIPSFVRARVASVAVTIAAADVSVNFPFDFAIRKDDSTDPIAAAGVEQYIIDPTYYGTNHFTGLVVTDSVPTGTTQVAGQINGGGTFVGSGPAVATWNLGSNAAPTPSSTPTGISSPTQFLRDDFDAGSFSNQDGTVDWTGSWVDSQSDGTTGGDIRITATSTGFLELRDNMGDASPQTVYRNFSLSGASTATLTLAYTSTLGTDDFVYLKLSTDNGSTYPTTIATWSSALLTGSGSLTYTFPGITFTSNMRLQFSGAAVTTTGSQTVAIDWIQIAHVTSGNTGAARDEFITAAYSNNDGGISWGANWTESGDDGLATAGNISIVEATDSDFSLSLANTVAGTTLSASRQIDLAGASAASVTFGYESTLNAGASYVVEADVDGNGTYETTVSTITGTGSGTVSPVSLSGAFASNAAIRIRKATSAAGTGAFLVKFIQVNVTKPSMTTSVALDADRSLISAVDASGDRTVGVRMTVSIAAGVSGTYTITPPASLTTTFTGGGTPSATLASGPTPASASITGTSGTVTFDYTYTVAPDNNVTVLSQVVNQLTFSGKPNNIAGAAFQTATSDSVIVVPRLRFNTTVNSSGTPCKLSNNATVSSTAGPYTTSATSLTLETEVTPNHSIGDQVYLDLNANGSQDAFTEPGLAGVRVYVDSNNNGSYDIGEPTAVSDIFGNYAIMCLGSGTYVVRIDPATFPSGFIPTTSPTLSVSTSSKFSGADFGLFSGQTRDFGDLVDTGSGTSAGNYETLLANNGPYHRIITGLRIGAAVDAESNGVSSAGANGDDTAGATPDDEEGIAGFPTFTQGTSGTISVTVQNTGSTATLYGFFDWNGDGDFNDSNETTSVTVPNGATSVSLPYSVPAGATLGGNHGMRLRLTSNLLTGTAAANGPASNGEVEDYSVTVVAPVTYDWGDLPHPSGLTATSTGNYATTSAQGGPSHVVGSLFLGSAIDSESDGQPNATATGDDIAGATPDDEDGVTIPTLTAGLTSTVVVAVSGGPGKLNAFFDWNNDGDFLDLNEVITEINVTTGANNLSVPVPAGAVTGVNIGARFRLSSAGGLASTGAATIGSGEVEDYLVSVGQPASIGNFVWRDDNGNGVQDEVGTGIAGVTVELYTGLGVLVTSTSTGGSGDYLFSGLAPGNYYVKFLLPSGYVFTSQDVNDGNPNPDDRDSDANTGTGQTVVTTLVAGENDLSWDAGMYQPAAIGNFVWVDLNANGIQDVGEVGIDGVTVELYRDANGDGDFLDGTESTSAYSGTTTSGGGIYNFTGLPPGNYFLKFTPPSGYSLSPQDQGGDDTVDSDANVSTFVTTLVNLSSGETDLTWDAGVYSTSRDFGDLRDITAGTATGDYQTLQANGGPSHLVYAASGFRLGAAIDADPDGQSSTAADGDDTDGDGDDEDGLNIPATLQVGSTVTFEMVLGAKPSGFTAYGNLWIDFNNDGDFTDVGEQVATDVVLSLGINFLSVALPGTATTATPLGVRARLSNVSGDASTGAGNFGEVEDYRATLTPIPTAALITAVTAWSVDGAGAVRWTTAYEAGTVGFQVKRLSSEGGNWAPITTDWVAALRSQTGGLYEVPVANLVTGETVTLQIEELEANGGLRTYGPYEVVVVATPSLTESNPVAADGLQIVAGTAPADQNFAPAGGGASARKLAGTTKEVTASLAAVAGLTPDRSGRAAYGRIETTEEGVHFVSAQDLAAAIGRSVEQITGWVRSGMLGLSTEGRTVTYLPAEDGSGVYFNARKASGLYSTSRVYLVSGIRNPASATVDGGSPVGRGAAWHRAIRRFEQDLEMVNTLTTDPTADSWIWNSLIPGNALFAKRTFPLSIGDLSVNEGDGTAALNVEFWGGDGGSRRIVAEVKGSGASKVVGEVIWRGRGAARLEASFESALLANGANSLVLRSEPVAGSGAGGLAYLNAYTVSYPASVAALAGASAVNAAATQVETIAGFRSDVITVLDVTEPDAPGIVVNTSIVADGTGHSVSFQTVAGHKYAAFEPSGVRSAKRIGSARAATLASPAAGADYVLIAPDSLISAAGSLAEYRRSQGLTAKVVSMTDIANEFGQGIPSPQSLSGFLRAAWKSWNVQPRYVVLVGDGTFDYRDLKGAKDNLIPPAMVATRSGLFASDSVAGDVDGDGIAEIAMGRLPVVSAAQFGDVLAKIKAQELRLPGVERSALVVADQSDAGGSFASDARNVETLLRPGYTTALATSEDAGGAVALRSRVLTSLSGDLDVLNYGGHGGHDRLGSSGYLTSSDVPTLDNLNRRLPIVVAMTCVAGNFAVPGTDALSENLVLQSGRGAIAVLAPTGLSMNSEAQSLSREVASRLANAANGSRLGDLIREAGRAYHESGAATEFLQIYNLIGDPALKVR